MVYPESLLAARNDQCGSRSSHVFRLCLFFSREQLVSKRALSFVRLILASDVSLSTWKALLSRKTRSYASFGGNLFNASCTVLFSSGMRSSDLSPAYRQPAILDFFFIGSSDLVFCNLMHLRTSWQMASSTS